MKNAVLPVAVGVAVLGCILAIYTNVGSSRLVKSLEAERYKRMNAEQQLQTAQQQINQLQMELGDAVSKMKTIEKVLNDGKELSNELEAVRKDRDALKEKLESLAVAAQ